MNELFVTVRLRIADLVPNAVNPRKIKQAEKRKLWERLQEFGMIGIPVVDVDGKLLSGHQRCELYMLYGYGDTEIDVRQAVRKLTEAEERKVMLTENSHAGDFDLQMLQDEFENFVNLDDYGISLDGLDKALSEVADADEEPEMAIVPKFSEQYSAVVIVIENSIDENFVRSVLGLQQVRDYKTSNVGESHVLTAKNFIELWKNR